MKNVKVLEGVSLKEEKSIRGARCPVCIGRPALFLAAALKRVREVCHPYESAGEADKQSVFQVNLS